LRLLHFAAALPFSMLTLNRQLYSEKETDVF
jgi:hypothetical protein